jgi:hypothetical protein
MLRITCLLISLTILSLPAAAAMTRLDEIVAIVDESVITQRDLSNRIQLVKVDFARTKIRCSARFSKR